MTNHNLVQVSGGRLVTTSLDIAQNFGKRHKHILEAVKNLECSAKFNETNFRPVEYTDVKGEKRPMYEITRDGFVFLCMGFTGAAAAQWKERYINAFNQMENHIVANQTQLQALKTAYLHDNPEVVKLLHYRDLGLNHSEISKLLGIGESTVGRRLRKYAQLGLTDYEPSPQAIARGKLRHEKMRQNQTMQQSLELGEPS